MKNNAFRAKAPALPKAISHPAAEAVVARLERSGAVIRSRAELEDGRTSLIVDDGESIRSVIVPARPALRGRAWLIAGHIAAHVTIWVAVTSAVIVLGVTLALSAPAQVVRLECPHVITILARCADRQTCTAFGAKAFEGLGPKGRRACEVNVGAR
jgi:hypothetical protein